VRFVLGRAVPKSAVSEERRRFLRRAAVSGAVVAAGSASTYGLWRAFHPPDVTELNVRLPMLPKALDGFRIVQISDIHVGDILHARFLRALVDRCNALRPDLMAVTGDLVDGSVKQLGSTVSELQRLKARYGTAFCMGNHEYYSGDVAWEGALTQMGLTVLRNRFVSVGDAGGSFDLVGVDDYGERRRPGTGYDLTRALAGRTPERASVLLAHRPQSFPDTVRTGLGLQLSGHTHGGQLFPFTLVAELTLPFNVGFFQQQGSAMYVNRGAGFWGPSMRVGSPPEITAVTLSA
jgi:predicted MPP superfamily phosphohydrolase